MQTVDLKVILDDKTVAKKVLTALGICDLEAAHRSLVTIANHGVTLDLLHDVLNELVAQLPLRPAPDLGLKNLERFIISSRSPISLAALLVRDPTALSSLLDIFTSSQFLSELLIKDPESFDLIRLTDGQPVAKQTLEQELKTEFRSSSSLKAEASRLRRFKHREMLRIGYGDIIRKFDIERTSQQLTYLADAICGTALDYCKNHLETKHGIPIGFDGNPAQLAVICHGRHGSGDMDYASPLLLSVIYDTDGQTHGKSKIPNADFFERMMDEFSGLISADTDQGICYPIEFDHRATRGSAKCSTLIDAIKFFDRNSTASDRLGSIQSRFL
ncbi:MAG: hypothetical protein VX438_04605, partial [Planctomycetota bacterium]|nr:hypothetical protein [Planctomycetota bacterium]